MRISDWSSDVCSSDLKRRAAQKVGIQAFDHDFPDGASGAELLALIDHLNADPAVHGILVQLPLPGIPDATRLIHRIDPRKDVDGFHPENVGHLARSEEHTSELQSLIRNSYAALCFKQNIKPNDHTPKPQ